MENCVKLEIDNMSTILHGHIDVCLMGSEGRKGKDMIRSRMMILADHMKENIRDRIGTSSFMGFMQRTGMFLDRQLVEGRGQWYGV